MIGQSLPEYLFILICIGLLRLVAPACLLHLILCLYSRAPLISPWFLLITVPEACFFLFVYLPRRKRLQQNTPNPPTPLHRKQREALFDKCSQPLEISGAPSYPLGWFTSHQVKRENVVVWLLWALFSCGPEDALDEWNEEIDGYVQQIEDLTETKFEPGRVDSTSSFRVTLDPVKMLHRPLIWYTIVAIVDLYSSVRLKLLGFQHFSPSTFLHVFPPRPFTFLSKPSATKHFSYWYRPHRTPDKDPVVFIHGIGIGLYPYIPFLRRLIETEPDVGILLIELLPVSMHMTAKPVLPKRGMLDALYGTMNSLGMNRAVMASHSYGTVIATHIIREARNRTDSSEDAEAPSPSGSTPMPLITSHLLVDPIPILLHLPDVAFNFLYRIPTKANEWQLWYFASRDPDVARTLSRSFFWEENILWKDDLVRVADEAGAKGAVTDTGVEGNRNGHLPRLQGKRPKIAVILSEDDQILRAPDVRKYLTGEEEVAQRWKKEDGSGSLEVLYYPGLDHATVFDTEERRRGLIRILREFVGAEGQDAT